MIIPVLIIFLFCAFWSVRAIHVAELFHNPLVIPMIFWILSYPVRYALILANPDLFSQSELSLSSVSAPRVEVISSVLLFAAAFVALIGFGLRAILPMHARTLSPVSLVSVRVTSQDQLLIHVIFLVYAVSFGYLTLAYGIVGLYDDFTQLKKSLAEAILGEITNLMWFVATICLLAFFRFKNRIYLIEFLLVTASVLLKTFLTTSKGMVLNLVIFLLLMLAIQGRRPPYGLLAVLLCFGVLFGVISYQMRHLAYFEVRDLGLPFAFLLQYGQLEFSIDSLALLIESNITTLIDRLTYYGDALILMANEPVRDASDLYVLGSLVEIGNLIPTSVWADRPHLSFNHHVTGDVWGLHGFLSETPIGRIGEAFYVGHWFGFLAGFAYAIIFALLCLLWHKVRKNLWGLATWSGLVMAWVVPDAYLTYGLKQVLFICCVGYVLYLLSRAPLLSSFRTRK